MSDVAYNSPAHRDHRGFRTMLARQGFEEVDELATHITLRDVTLWYGSPSPTTLPAGTPIRVLHIDEDIVRFTYAGIGASTEYAISGADLVDPTRQVASPADEDAEWTPRRPTDRPEHGSQSCAAARSPSVTQRPSSSSSGQARKTAGASSRSSSGLTRSSSASRSSGSSRTTSPSAERRTVPDIG